MKYIEPEKLKTELESIYGNMLERTKIDKDNSDYWAGKADAYRNVIDTITSLQQEQPETPSGEEVMTMCNQILLDWVKEGKTPEEREQREQAHIRFFELYDEYMQGQPEVDLEKLGGIARHLIAVKDHEEDMRLDEGEWRLLERIGYPERFNARKEESVSVAESQSKTFPRVNEFDCGSSYRH